VIFAFLPSLTFFFSKAFVVFILCVADDYMIHCQLKQSEVLYYV